MTQQAGDAGEHRVHRRLLPVLPGLHQARRARRRGIRKPGIVDDAAPAHVALVGHHQRRHAGAECKPLSLRRGAAQDQRIRRPQHRVQVEQHIHRVDQRPDLARAVELGGAPRAVQHRRVPHPVDVLVDEARRGRLARIEPLVSGEVDEAERQPAACRRQSRLEQPVEHDRAGDLIAMRNREQRHMRAGHARIARDEAANAGIAGQPAADVGRGEVHLE